MARSRTDEQLLDSVFRPDDPNRTYMTVNREGTMIEGNHRRWELMERASDPNSETTWDTPIYIHNFKENNVSQSARSRLDKRLACNHLQWQSCSGKYQDSFPGSTRGIDAGCRRAALERQRKTGMGLRPRP
jgi:hypothetical protein